MAGADDISKELVSSGVQSPLDSPNAEFLYLYGRANLLSGNTDEAGKAFDAAISQIGRESFSGQCHNQKRGGSRSGRDQRQDADAKG